MIKATTDLEWLPLFEALASDVRLKIERNSWTLRIGVEEGANNVGGLTLYGTGFGNYNQDIVFRTYY